MSVEPSPEPVRRPRLTLGAVMVFMLAAASASALAAKTHETFGPWQEGWDYDIPALLLLGIVLSAVVVACLRRHSGVQMMLQVAVSCVLILPLFELADAGWERTARYWFQATFALTIAGPLLIRRAWPATPEARPGWGRGLVELLLCCGLNLMLVGLGFVAEVLLTELVS